LAKSAAIDFKASFEKAAPKVIAWQSKIRDQAHKERKLTNAFGYSRSWYDVYTKKDGVWKLGSEANKVLAFLPQSTGAGILCECIYEIDKALGDDPNFHMLIPEHDALLAEAHQEQALPQYMPVMRSIMEAPIPALGGLTIETEGEIGPTWLDMVGCL
jgi:DNA polymerase I-like protein with 3'-5' exonuclease and polymerase domains